MCSQSTQSFVAGTGQKTTGQKTKTISSRRKAGAPMPRVRQNVQLRIDFVRLFDVIFSATLLLFLLPSLLIIAGIIYVFHGGPVLFCQERVGYKGTFFKCYKFRSMHLNSDRHLQAYLDANPDEAESWRIYRKLKRDPRVLPFGRFLRKASLDEFPQLINVLRGEMSLVGPRPILTDEIQKYGCSLRNYITVRPGITGLWQVMGRNNLSYRKRVVLDRMFVRRYSLWFYFKLLFMTVPVVLLQRGSR